MSDASSRILRSIEAARSYARGQLTEGFAVHVPPKVGAQAARQAPGLSERPADGLGSRKRTSSRRQ